MRSFLVINGQVKQEIFNKGQGTFEPVRIQAGDKVEMKLEYDSLPEEQPKTFWQRLKNRLFKTRDKGISVDLKVY